MSDSPTPDDAAVLAGAEVEIPAGQEQSVQHTTRTIADLEADDTA